MTHWARKLGIAVVVALALGVSVPATADASPSFCRSGAGHPKFGREWCIRKGFGLGGGTYRYGRPSWSYTPYYRSGYDRWNGWYSPSWDRSRYSRYGSDYGYRYRDRDRDGRPDRWERAYHRHDGGCRH